MRTYTVQSIESELGWGQRVDETLCFNTREEAEKFSNDYNAKWNTKSSVPDWYMYATYVGKVN